jgi:hypothetical protein
MQTSDQTSSGKASATPAPPTAAKTACDPCDIPAFCRSYFYTGKLLTEGDLNREQRYMIDKLRLHYVALHGWGVACGLMVRPHPHCPDRFVVTPGFSVDSCGREIRLVKDCVVMLPKPPEPIPEPCDDDKDEDDEHRRPEPKCQTYYVCIRYNECREDFMPVVFSDCCGSSNQPNRVCECAAIELVTERPDCLEDIERRRHHERREESCHELWEHLPKECPPTAKVCCIPLAIIRDYRYYEPLTESMIDNAIRPVMPSVHRLEELIHCVMEHLPKPAPRLTRISRFHWDHDREYHPREFLNEFVGSHESPRGFEIEFDGRVHTKGLNNRTFQALIVRETESHEPRRMEIAPARVHRSEDGRRCTLHIDPDYARHHLHDHNFDVFLTLRCDKVIDERGLPVDGNLLAALQEDDEHDYVLKLPTGDGVPGGLFESWIRIRRER